MKVREKTMPAFFSFSIFDGVFSSSFRFGDLSLCGPLLLSVIIKFLSAKFSETLRKSVPEITTDKPNFRNPLKLQKW